MTATDAPRRASAATMPNPLLDPRLDFESSPTVSALVRREFIDSLAKASRQPPAAIEQLIRGRDFISDFGQWMAPYDLNLNNLGDVVTGYWVSMWSIIHEAPLPPAGHVASAREQCRRMWHNNPVTRKPEARQQLAELMMYETVASLDQRRDAHEAGNTQALAALARHAHANMRQQRGIDLGAMRLTQQGFGKMR